MRQCMDAENLHRRLAKILGQIQAIDRMVDEDVPCEDILSQIKDISNTVYVMGLKTEIQRKPSKVLRRQWNGSPI